jgi:cytoskeletal protein RodZ
MTPTEARELGRRRLAERRSRVRLMRRRIVGGAVAVFLGVWGVIFTQLATGHDPGLSASSAKQSTTSTTTTSESSGSSGSSGSSSDSSGSSSDDSGASSSSQSSGGSAVATHQS